ncbi:MAG: aminoacetone oxidase family FAD-binding enzyme [Planctomycetaceae bacterium]|nr:aminoacetone oxidase family FAD-binding enzyme [Planctomycetaceae bacterium]
MEYPSIIIGAGPAGLAAGIALLSFSPAARRLGSACILERNVVPGRKLLLSGSGQCNLTHGGNIADFLKHYGSPQKALFVKPALFAFTNTDAIRFFTERGVPLAERDDGKVFPKSLNSKDVLNALRNEFQRSGGILQTETTVLSVQKTDESFIVQTNRGQFVSQKLVIAAGGCSYPATGSDGSGWTLAEQLGHTVVPPKPALTPVYVQNYAFTGCAGISFKQINIIIEHGGKRIAANCGDVLFTHHGLSGPGILDISRLIKAGDTVKLAFSGRTCSALTTLLTGGKNLKNALSPLGIPEQFLVQLLKYLHIDPDKSASVVSRTERKNIESALNGLPFVVEKLGNWNEAMAAAGGVALNEVNRQTMESRLVPGLFFCGEVLDIDGDTGGYNIQFALSSGAAVSPRRCGS